MHLSLAHDASVLVGAFPVDQEEEAVDAFYSTWAWVGYEVEQRCGVDNEEPDIDLWNGRRTRPAGATRSQVRSLTIGQIWNWSGILFRVSQGVVLVAIAGACLSLLILFMWCLGELAKVPLVTWLVVVVGLC